PFARRAAFLDLRDSTIDRAACDTRYLRHQRHAAVPKHTRFSSRKPPPCLLVEHRFQRIEALPNQIRAIRHASRLRDAIPAVNPPTPLSIAPEAFLIHLFMQAALAWSWNLLGKEYCCAMQ